MADDPWAQFVPGAVKRDPSTPAVTAPKPASAAAGADPWAQFVPGATPTPSPLTTSAPISPSAPGAVGQGQDLGTTALWNKPANASWGDYMLAHLAGAVKPLSGVADPRQNVNEALAFGSGLTGGAQNLIPDVKTRTAQAFQELDPQTAFALSGAGYLAGPGKLGIASKVGEAVAPTIGGWAAPAVGGAAEGALSSGAGTAFQGGSAADITRNALFGGGAGLVAGGVLGRPGAPDVTPPEVGRPQSSAGPATGMYAQKVAAYSPLDSIAFDNHGQALNQAQAAVRAVRDPNGLGVDLGIPKDVNDIVTNLGRNPLVSGRNLQQASSDLRATGDWTGHRFADAIDTHLDTAPPIPGYGQIGEAGAAKNAGDLINGRINDLERLAKESPSGAPGPTPAAVQATKEWHDPGAPQYDALSALQQSMQPSFNWWHARHIAGPLLGAGLGAAEGFFNPAEKQNPYLTAATQGLEGAALFSGLPALARARPGNALNTARYVIGTGQPAPAGTPGPLGDALLKAILGQGAANQQWPY
jgi:hypothetical protein